jgi:hypothetical protein
MKSEIYAKYSNLGMAEAVFNQGGGLRLHVWWTTVRCIGGLQSTMHGVAVHHAWNSSPPCLEVAVHHVWR